VRRDHEPDLLRAVVNAPQVREQPFVAGLFLGQLASAACLPLFADLLRDLELVKQQFDGATKDQPWTSPALVDTGLLGGLGR
jgi:hypothetical protein